MSISVPIDQTAPVDFTAGRPCYTLKLPSGFVERLQALASSGESTLAGVDTLAIDIPSAAASTSLVAPGRAAAASLCSAAPSKPFALHAFGKTLPLQHLDNASMVELYCHHPLPTPKLVPVARGLTKLVLRQEESESARDRLAENYATAEEQMRARHSLQIDDESAARAAKRPRDHASGTTSSSSSSSSSSGGGGGGGGGGPRKRPAFRKRRLALPWEEDPSTVAESRRFEALIAGERSAQKSAARRSPGAGAAARGGGKTDAGSGCAEPGSTSATLQMILRAKARPQDKQHQSKQQVATNKEAGVNHTLVALLATTQELREKNRAIAQRRAAAARHRYTREAPGGSPPI